jgi:PBP1b-binding outer membrane lipoprotein LpoB
MFKRVLRITLLALLLVSCEQDNLVIHEPQAEVEITFNFDFENVDMTRAISDGTQVDELMYAIFNAENNQLVISKSTKKNASGATSTSGLTTHMTLT